MGNSNANGFGSRTTAQEVVDHYHTDLAGKIVLITGANCGIGYEAARVLAKCNAHVVVACRDMKKADKAVDELKSDTGNKNIEAIELDLNSLASVRKCAEEFHARYEFLHVLIANAGVMIPPYTKTADGFELQMGVNHFGHFLLTNLLLDKIKKSAPARIVVVSSAAHDMGFPVLDDINFEKRSYSAWTAYGASKAANILFACELNRRLEGAGVTANSLHPGVIATDLTRHSKLTAFMFTIGRPFNISKSVHAGAATSVYCAVSPDIEGVGGKYFLDCNQATPRRNVQAEEFQKEFWTFSEKAVGI